MTSRIAQLRVVVVAPGSRFDRAQLDENVASLRNLGADVHVSENILRQGHPYLNGSDDERIAELQSALLRDDCDVIWLARAGYGLTRIVGKLDNLRRRSGPQAVVVGYSDATAWHAQNYLSTAPQVHGPLITELHQLTEGAHRHLMELLSNRCEKITMPLTKIRWNHERVVAVAGPILCANLCVLSHLVGTTAFPNLRGSILLLEDVGEPPYRIDRMMTQLRYSGSLDGVVALVVGTFAKTTHDKLLSSDAACILATKDAEQAIVSAMEGMAIPVVGDAKVGHIRDNLAIWQGGAATITPADVGGVDAMVLSVTRPTFWPGPRPSS